MISFRACSVGLAPLRLALLVGLLWGASGCSDDDKGLNLPPPVVTIAHPIEREMVDSAVFTGRTSGSEFVEIRARVSGYLSKIDFQPGTFIEQGSPLFEIDDRPYQATLSQAEGESERAKARLNRTELDLARGETLIARKVITKEEYDRLVADHAEAAAVVRSAEATVQRARLDLEWTKIDAPISGIVSRELLTVGNLVVADQTLLTTIVKHDPMYVYFDIDEHTVLKILDLIREGKFQSARENQVPIEVGLATDEGFPLKGYINFVENRLDRGSGTMEVRGEIPNPREGATVRLHAGLFARARMEFGSPFPALLVSERSILSEQDRKYVYVVNDKQVVERREVKVGQLDEGYRVILEGLKPTDWVIVNGTMRVRPGITVDAQQEPPQTGPADLRTRSPASEDRERPAVPSPNQLAPQGKEQPASLPAGGESKASQPADGTAPSQQPQD